jgi:hypothetical protein
LHVTGSMYARQSLLKLLFEVAAVRLEQGDYYFIEIGTTLHLEEESMVFDSTMSMERSKYADN